MRGKSELRQKEITVLGDKKQPFTGESLSILSAQLTEAIKRRRARQAELDVWLGDLVEVLDEVEAARPQPDFVDELMAEIDAAVAEIDYPEASSFRAELTCKLPQKTAKRKPRSVARDARNIRKCRALSGQHGATAPNTGARSLVDSTTHPSTTPLTLPHNRQSPYSSSYSKHLMADRNDKRKLAAWRYTGDLAKIYAVGQALQEVGGIAFSLNLAGRVKDRVDARPGDALSYLSDRLVKALKAEFGRRVELAFVLEVSPAGHAHLHGILDLDASQKDRARRALEKAGGQWAGNGKQYQADARRLWDAGGWTNYCSKALARTKRALGLGNVLSITNDLRRRAKGYWDRMREAEGQALSQC